MEWKYADLVLISMKIDSPKDFPPLAKIDLKKVKEFYFKAKEIFLSIDYPNNYEVEVMIEIFGKGIKKVGEFFTSWREGNIKPTDEELDLLVEACDEASNNFNILAEKFPVSFPAEVNQKNQEEIAKGKEFVLEEKIKRTNSNDPKQQEDDIKKLQSQLNSLKNQLNNSDNEAKIRDLQKQIDELKDKKRNSPPNPTQENKKNHNREDKNKIPWNVIVPIGLIIVLLGLIIIIYKKSQSK